MDCIKPYQMKFDVYTIKHLGLQMYSTLPSVIAEFVANCWDANATKVEIVIPTTPIDGQTSEITIEDNGTGMSDADVRAKYFTVGRNRRNDESSDITPTPFNRKVMGRKGIGKFSAFGIAKEIEVESVSSGQVSRFLMNYDELLKREADREIEFPPLLATGAVSVGTKITLRYITKFQARRISIDPLRRRLARRFSVIDAQSDFAVSINGKVISHEDRDLKQLLENDADGNPYLWEYDNVEIESETGWTVSGWIGALNRTSSPTLDNIDRGIVLMARGKMVQEPFVFDAGVGQQFALSYLVGELHVEFVDDTEDTIGTSRNSLVWDTEANTALKEWGQNQVNAISRQWAEKRSRDNVRQLNQNELYRRFRENADSSENRRAFRLADRLVRQTISSNLAAPIKDIEPVIQMSLDFLEFDAFQQIAEDLTEADTIDTVKIINLFREWQIVEAKEMSRVISGRIKTIEKFQNLIDKDAMEVPTLHNFLKEFPWVIDPRWTLVDDEVRYSVLLRDRFPESNDIPESDRRIDFLCVQDSHNLAVVEIKRPRLRASVNDLNQIEDYVSFMRNYVRQTTDPTMRRENVTGYLICGKLVDNYRVTEKAANLENAQIYIRNYGDLLHTVREVHREFIQRYDKLRAAKQLS